MRKFIIILFLLLNSCSVSVRDAFLENIKGTYKKDNKTFIIDNDEGTILSLCHGRLNYYGSRYSTEGIYYQMNTKKYMAIRITYSNNIKILHNSGNFPTPDKVTFVGGSWLFGADGPIKKN